MDEDQVQMFATISPESIIPVDHPLRKIKKVVNPILKSMSPLFDDMYSNTGRPSISPEKLLKATLLMALYTVRGERQFCEQLGYNLLFKWFLDMNYSDKAFDHSVFSKNRQRLINHDIGKAFFEAVVDEARLKEYVSDEHFSVDGTLVDAWASMKSFRPKGEPKDKGPSGRNPWMNFKKEKRTNETHESKTDPDAKMYRKSEGQEARLRYTLNGVMENRNGMLVKVGVESAGGKAERAGAIKLFGEMSRNRKTVGGDKGYDTKDFTEDCRDLNITPHVAQNDGRKGGSSIDERTTRHVGYEISLVKRMKIEEIFGWIKTVGNFKRTRYRGLENNRLMAHIVGAGYNLVRMAKMEPVPG
jgi:transposase